MKSTHVLAVVALLTAAPALTGCPRYTSPTLAHQDGPLRCEEWHGAVCVRCGWTVATGDGVDLHQGSTGLQFSCAKMPPNARIQVEAKGDVRVADSEDNGNRELVLKLDAADHPKCAYPKSPCYEHLPGSAPLALDVSLRGKSDNEGRAQGSLMALTCQGRDSNGDCILRRGFSVEIRTTGNSPSLARAK